jgi:hypothetical protein
MKYFLDTEFYEHGYARIDLISIALVCEDGREFYAVAGDGWDPKQVSPWLRDNVLPWLQTNPDLEKPLTFTDVVQIRWEDEEVWDELRKIDIPVLSRDSIRNKILEFVHPTQSDGTKPEFWGYFADYDWVLFCQLFGTMIQLPKRLPMYCNDLKQEMRRLEISREELPPQEGAAHNALADARHLAKTYKWLKYIEERQLAERLAFT